MSLQALSNSLLKSASRTCNNLAHGLKASRRLLSSIRDRFSAISSRVSNVRGIVILILDLRIQLYNCCINCSFKYVSLTVDKFKLCK